MDNFWIIVMITIIWLHEKKYILWWDYIRYLVCSPHFWYVFGCKFGISHHFRGKNGVIFGMVWHFWIFDCIRDTDIYRTLYRGSIYRSTIYYNMTGSTQRVKHFHLTASQFLTCKNVQNTSYTKKYTIILYYYSMFYFNALTY